MEQTELECSRLHACTDCAPQYSASRLHCLKEFTSVRLAEEGVEGLFLGSHALCLAVVVVSAFRPGMGADTAVV
jgi:hypothetical protein